MFSVGCMSSLACHRKLSRLLSSLAGLSLDSHHMLDLVSLVITSRVESTCHHRLREAHMSLQLTFGLVRHRRLCLALSRARYEKLIFISC
jgi:hypothetical protein